MGKMTRMDYFLWISLRTQHSCLRDGMKSNAEYSDSNRKRCRKWKKCMSKKSGYDWLRVLADAYVLPNAKTQCETRPLNLVGLASAEGMKTCVSDVFTLCFQSSVVNVAGYNLTDCV